MNQTLLELEEHGTNTAPEQSNEIISLENVPQFKRNIEDKKKAKQLRWTSCFLVWREDEKGAWGSG